MSFSRPIDIEDNNPPFSKDIKGPFNGQGKFLQELPTIIGIMCSNLGELEEESEL